MDNELKLKIQQIKKENPKLGYKAISDKVGCAKSTVRYHLNPSEKEAVRNRVRKLRKSQHPLYRKLIGFCTNYGDFRRKSRRNNKCEILSLQIVLDLIGQNPKCYLTGDSIDILDISTYSLDHKIPLSKGGTSTIDNLGLATRQANSCKSDLTPEELFLFCKKVLENQGYTVTK